NHQHYSQLDEAQRMAVQNSANGATQAAELSRLPAEDMIPGEALAALHQQPGASGQRNHCREQEAAAQDAGDDARQRVVGHIFPRRALAISSTANAATRALKRMRKARTLAPARKRAPASDPASTPSMTGIARKGSTKPLLRYTPALAAAVTPIMKLLVVAETLNGMRITRSMAMTFSEPDPMANRPERIPATNIRTNPPPILCT